MPNESELIFIEATRLEQFTAHFYLLCRRKSTVSVHESFCIVSGSIDRTGRESVHFYARRVAIKIVSFLFLNPAGYWPTEAFTYETSCFASHRIKIKCSNEPYFRSYSHLRVSWSLLNAKLREIYQARREGVVSRKKLSFYITLLNITATNNTIIYLYISLIAHYPYLFTCIPNIRSHRTSLKYTTKNFVNSSHTSNHRSVIQRSFNHFQFNLYRSQRRKISKQNSCRHARFLVSISRQRSCNVINRLCWLKREDERGIKIRWLQPD